LPRHFHQHVSEDETAGSNAVSKVAKTNVMLHIELCDVHIHAV